MQSIADLFQPSLFDRVAKDSSQDKSIVIMQSPH